MSSLQEIEGLVNQVSPGVLVDGDSEKLRMTKLGQLFTADWHTRLVLAGRAFELALGTTSGDTTATGLTGNAAHDNDQPEIVIACDSGWLIPLEIEIAIQVNDDDAYDDMTQISFFADRTQTVAAGATATIATALNHLDGGTAFGGRCYTTVTGDITNPAPGDTLGFKYWENTQLGTETAANLATTKNYAKNFAIPRFLAGPCSILGYVIGTNTPAYFGSFTFAHIPANYVPIS